jgi:pectinesterase
VRPEGWNDWNKLDAHQTARYAEFNSTGPGANPKRRAQWAKQLTRSQAAEITPSKVLSGMDGWNPTTRP